MVDIFISYAREDRAKVAVIAESLTKRGLKVWWDPHIKTGAGFREEITAALASTRCVIVAWSVNSVASRFVADEADDGAQRGILFPVLLDLVDIPLGFRQIQTADLTRWRGSPTDRSLIAFLDTVEETLGGARPDPRPAPEPKPEAERKKEPTPAKPARRKPQRGTITGSQVRAALFLHAFVLAVIVAGLFAGLAYLDNFALPSLRPYFVAIVGVLVFVSRYLTFAADGRSGAASLRLISRSYFALICAALVATAPAILEARIYAAALNAVRMRGIEGADINAAAFSKDGKLFATASDDGTARVWDSRYGVERAELRGHDNWVWSVDFNGAGDRLVTASRDLTARVWDLRSRKAVLILKGHRNSVYAAEFSPKGDLIATGSGDNTVRLWRADTGELAGTLTGHSDDVVALDFSPSGARLASASKDGAAIVWSVSAGRALMRLRGADGALTSIRYAPSGARLAAGSENGDAYIWSADDGRLLRRISYKTPVFNVAFAEGGKLLLISSGDGEVRIVDAASGVLMSEHHDHTDAVRALAASDAAKAYVSGSRDNTAIVRDIETGNELTVVGHVKPALRSPVALDAPPALYASRAPTPVNVRSDGDFILLSFGKGLALAFALLAIGLLLKGVFALARLRGPSKFAVVAVMTLGFAYAGALMLTALPLEAFILWLTAAFAPAVILAALRYGAALAFGGRR
ncbi:MAG: TIR domain-containing protein [Alphaproteobacteria bacterium]|nr:TIR domain-containing protein [Alphaproteobacteria bacterium]